MLPRADTCYPVLIRERALQLMGQQRLPQPAQRCFPLLPLYPRIADQVDAQVKVVGLVP